MRKQEFKYFTHIFGLKKKTSKKWFWPYWYTQDQLMHYKSVLLKEIPIGKVSRL